MTAAPHFAIGNTLATVDDANYSVFQLLNTPTGTQLVCGNIFLGLQGYCAVVIPLGTAPNLALTRGGKILTDLINCAVTFVADGTWTAGGQILVNCMIDNGPRGGPLDSRLAWKPAGYSSPSGWRRDVWGVFDQRLEDTGGTPFLDNGTGGSGSFAINPVVGLRDEMAGMFTVPAGPGWSVARAILLLRRFGTPTGSMEVAIQGSMSDGEGHVLPDGADVAVSAPVVNTTIPLTPGTGAMTFAFTPDAVLPPGTYWTVMRPSVAYTPNFADFIVWMQKRQFLGIGGAHRHSLDVPRRLDGGNFPGHADMSMDLGIGQAAGADIVWDVPATSAGQTRQTPDLSPLVQEVILRAGHETANALCFTFRTVSQTRTFRFAAHGHPTRSPPGFVCQYSRRQVRAEGAL